MSTRIIVIASITLASARVLKPSPPMGLYSNTSGNVCVETNWINEPTQNSIILGARCGGPIIYSAKLGYNELKPKAYFIKENSWKNHDRFLERVQDECDIIVSVEPGDLFKYYEVGDEIQTEFQGAGITLKKWGC